MSYGESIFRVLRNTDNIGFCWEYFPKGNVILGVKEYFGLPAFLPECAFLVIVVVLGNKRQLWETPVLFFDRCYEKELLGHLSLKNSVSEFEKIVTDDTHASSKMFIPSDYSVS